MIKELFNKLKCKIYGHKYVKGNIKRKASDKGLIYSYCAGIKDKTIKIPTCNRCNKEMEGYEMKKLNEKFFSKDSIYSYKQIKEASKTVTNPYVGWQDNIKCS